MSKVMRKYEVIFMDADNTLFDYDAAEKNALSHTFLEYGYPFDKDVLTAYRKINSNLWAEFE